MSIRLWLNEDDLSLATEAALLFHAPMLDPFVRRPLAWASAAPLLCALHCIATPLVVLTAPSFAPDPRAEAALLIGTAVVSVVASAVGVREHGGGAVLIPVLTGLLLWVFSLRGAFLPLPEGATTALASLLVAGGLLWNARRRHRAVCPECGCRNCAEETVAQPRTQLSQRP